MGRLLITLFLVERDILPAPLLYLSAFFEATRPDYYRRLQAVRDEGDWQGWLLYFLRGVARQAEDAVRRAERINELVVGWRSLAAESSSRAVSKLVDLLAENPYWTVKRVAERLDVAYTTAQRASERLIDAGVMQQVGDAKRDRLFRATEILAVLEEPTRLDAAQLRFEVSQSHESMPLTPATPGDKGSRTETEKPRGLTGGPSWIRTRDYPVMSRVL